MTVETYRSLGVKLSDLLKLQSPPLAIGFSMEAPEGVAAFEGPLPEPTADGRTGKVAAGCVFWMKATERRFTTVPEDHGNCSVGSMTHGFKTLEAAASKSDVATLVASGWVNEALFPQIPVVKQRYNYVTYGPLAETPEDPAAEPDVVFLRLNAKQAMLLSDALPDLRFEGKPQCHIIPMAKEQNEIAVSVGCMLSRVRTEMGNSEMTCAIPAKRLAEVVQKLDNACAADNAVARYASEDASRFATDA